MQPLRIFNCSHEVVKPRACADNVVCLACAFAFVSFASVCVAFVSFASVCLIYAVSFLSSSIVLGGEWSTFVLRAFACALDCSLWWRMRPFLPFQFGHLPFQGCHLLVVFVVLALFAVRHCEKLTPVFHPVLRVSIRKPESSLDRVAFFEAQSQCLFPELVFVLEAVCAGKCGPHYSSDVSLESDIVFVEQIFQKLHPSVLDEIRVHLPAGLTRQSEKPEVCQHLILRLEIFCVCANR